MFGFLYLLESNFQFLTTALYHQAQYCHELKLAQEFIDY